jgi:hypothetical protein
MNILRHIYMILSPEYLSRQKQTKARPREVTVLGYKKNGRLCEYHLEITNYISLVF